MNIVEFLDRPELIGGSFEGESRAVMRSVLTAAWGLPLDKVQREHFDSVAGGREPPCERGRAR